jgi:hypothetical protein
MKSIAINGSASVDRLTGVDICVDGGMAQV